MEQFIITKEEMTAADVRRIVEQNLKIGISSEVESDIKKGRAYLEKKLKETDTLYYGINTGFGSLCNVRIDETEIENLQRNLVVSHACGTGDEIPKEMTRLILLLKIRSLAYGFSGVRLLLVKRLIQFYNEDALPVIFKYGSLGASGDLAPLAHVSLALIGEGEMDFHGERMSAEKAHQKLGIQPLVLQSKEGLALLNGTQFSLAFALWSSIQSNRLSQYSDLIASLSLDAFNCKAEPFDHRIHDNRPHTWQGFTAKRVLSILKGSEILPGEKTDVQDPYAFRCIPQVHGASKSTIDYVRTVVETELNSITDNPNIFPDSDAILSGGNFHAQPLALASDFLAIALSELGSISERRVYQLISGKRNLPGFLTEGAGLHSGFMIPQYTAASLASANKQLCTPASVDSIVSCNGQEDHVSMAANAGRQVFEVVKNVNSLLAIELMVAAQGLEFRRPAKSSPAIEAFHSAFRKYVPVLEGDRIMSKDMKLAEKFLDDHSPEDFIPNA